MNIESYRNYCISLSGVTESFPFGENTLVFKVMNKMFALTDVEKFEFINLKCEPEKAILLREQYEGISPGWHMSKKHWNSVKLNSDIDDKLLKELVIHSYELVLESLPNKLKEELKLRS